MRKNKFGFKVGDTVFLRHTYGPKAGSVNEDYTYKIKKIGPKEATLTYFDRNIGHENSRGQVYRLTSQADADARAQHSISNGWSRNYMPVTWNQYFVLLGNEGWDSDSNWG